MVKRAAILIADVVEFSRHMEQDEGGSVDQVARSIRLFRSLIGDYGGQIAQIAGDGILALFDSADRTLQFAVQIQTEFRDQSVWGNGEPIQFRIGLNVGEVTIHEAVAYGHCINVAARLQGMADPGGILVTGAFRSAMEATPGLSLRSVGQPRLKNLSEPIDIYAVEPSGATPTNGAIRPRDAPLSEPVRNPSIAVLAVSNLSGDPRNDHLCDGFSEDIIANLSRFRNLMVIARHSAFLFNLNTNPTEVVKRQLGVRYILWGSLRRAGQRLRFAFQLIDAASDSVLWSDRFKVELDELFDLQDEIAGAVASRLSIQIDLAEWRQQSPYPRDMRAYGLVLRGQHLILKFTKAGNWHARRLFEEALGYAPEYSRAHSALSRTHNLDWRYAWAPRPQRSLELAIVFARRSKEFDPLDARGFAELGYAKLYRRQHDDAIAEYEQALSLNPNDSDIIAEYADALAYVEQAQRSVELMHKAMRLNPHYPDWYLWYLADAYDTLGQPENVIATIQRMHDPSEGQRMLAANFAHLGMTREAQAAAREVLRLHPGFKIGVWRERPPYRDKAIIERYVEGLRKAGLPD
ncbi:adenylate/guanylate cyclase domain-containing protein [Bradyrhizobium sp.]|uniref:adenylate/guanylate cyclase domain-containing protein n=1 Tax=Bradyrhizobium sp. TaxID=376 RepID=UPI00345DE545